MNGKNGFYRVIGKFISTIVGCAVLFVIGIAVAAVVKKSTFSLEWANMIAWFQTWAK